MPTPAGPERLPLCLEPVCSPARPSAPEYPRAPQASEACPGPGQASGPAAAAPHGGSAGASGERPCTFVHPVRCPPTTALAPGLRLRTRSRRPSPPSPGAQTPVHARWASHTVRIPRALLPGEAPVPALCALHHRLRCQAARHPPPHQRLHLRVRGGHLEPVDLLHHGAGGRAGRARRPGMRGGPRARGAAAPGGDACRCLRLGRPARSGPGGESRSGEETGGRIRARGFKRAGSPRPAWLPGSAERASERCSRGAGLIQPRVFPLLLLRRRRLLSAAQPLR